jgi:hypothetical protein
MFRWYMESDVCYTYLFDVETSGAHDQTISLEQLEKSRWISRGWTLQELIAPRTVRFFSSDWTECGDRGSLGPSLSQITNIDLEILQRSPSGDELDLIYSLSIAKRMSWAAARQTTRPEDTAYCLLGLFNVNMVMLYGEGGPRAFYRLQEEIMKSSTDQTILAWSPSQQSSSRMSVLADSPSAFHDGSRIFPIEEEHHFEMTSRGLQLNPRIFDLTAIPLESESRIAPKGLQVIMLSCVYADDPSGQLGLIVGQMKGEGKSGVRFTRVMQCPVIIPLEQVRQWLSTHKPDGTSILSRRQFTNFGTGFDVEKYLDAMQRVVGQQKIYIAHVITHSRQRDIGNANYLLKHSIISNKKSKRRFSLVYFDELTSLPNTALPATEIVGKVSEHGKLEVHLIEHVEIGPDPLLCRVIFLRSTQDQYSTILNISLRCFCGGNCRQGDPIYGLGRWIKCDVYGIHVNVTLEIEERSGRMYNIINLEVSYQAEDKPLALFRGFLKSST